MAAGLQPRGRGRIPREKAPGGPTAHLLHLRQRLPVHANRYANTNTMGTSFREELLEKSKAPGFTYFQVSYIGVSFNICQPPMYIFIQIVSKINSVSNFQFRTHRCEYFIQV